MMSLDERNQDSPKPILTELTGSTGSSDPSTPPQEELHTVSMWTRLGIFIIDQLFIGSFAPLVFSLLARIGLHIPEALVIDTNREMHFNSIGYLALFTLNFLYYFILESWKGQTLGKIITRTVVVNRYDELPSWTEIALRTLCRFIPLEPLSFIPDGIGWHDKLSKTYVRQLEVSKP